MEQEKMQRRSWLYWRAVDPDRHAVELSKCWLVVIASADPFPETLHS
jgi:hypothetical protein